MTTQPIDRMTRLLQKARSLPRVAGVYLMKDAAGRVLYVGKARILPNRVSSYFIPSTDLGPKKQQMLMQIEDFDHVECEDEWEALLAENRLIKDIHPYYNTSLTDDKTYPYLVITSREDFPGVYITRNPSAPEYRNGKIFGPFTSGYAVKESIQLLQRAFRFRTCHLEIREDDDKRKFFRPCLLYPIKQCTAPCAAKICKADYRADIERFVRFIESKRSVVLRQMRQEMEDFSRNLEFEKAAVLRDQIHALEKLEQRGKKSQQWQPEAEISYSDPKKGCKALSKVLGLDQPVRTIECFDIAHLMGGQTVGSKVCFIDGRPFKNEYRRFKITTAGNDDYTSIREVVSRRYRQAGEGKELYPDVIIIDGGLGQLHAALEAIAALDIKPPMVISLAKKEELIYLQARSEPIRLARNHAGLRLCQAIRDEAHRFAQHYHHILRKKNQITDQKIEDIET